MRNLRKSVVLAWVFCIMISVESLIHAAYTLVQGLPTSQPFMLASNVVFALLPSLFAIPAALIIFHQPRNTIGWLLMILPLGAIPTDLMVSYLISFKTTPPPATFPVILMVMMVNISWVGLVIPLLMIPLFFPTGRLLSPRWRCAVYLAIAICLLVFLWGAFSQSFHLLDHANWEFTNPIGFISNEADQALQLPLGVMLALLTVASLASIVVRFRRASSVEREQMKWLLYTCAVFVVVFLPGLFTSTESDFSILVYSLVIIGFPATITIAILRYHLFDIDVIIRLTLVYLILTGLLGVVYLGGVILIQQAFRALTGQSTDAAVVITTLAIAALFTPLRLRIQTIIDQRFFRQKYNAEQALARFSVAARGSADLDALTSMLVDITQEALQPTQVGLHLTGRK